MKVSKYVLVVAGSIVLITALLGFFYSKYWLFATMLIGANLLQFGMTEFCPLTLIVGKIKGEQKKTGCCFLND